MKKLIIIGILSLLLIGLVTAITYTNKESALSFISSKFTEKESKISDVSKETITYINKVKCKVIGVEPETEPNCYVSFTYGNNDIVYTLEVDENSNVSAIDKLVKEYIIEMVQESYDIIITEYEGLDIKDRSVSIGDIK